MQANNFLSSGNVMSQLILSFYNAHMYAMTDCTLRVRHGLCSIGIAQSVSLFYHLKEIPVYTSSFHGLALVLSIPSTVD